MRLSCVKPSEGGRTPSPAKVGPAGAVSLSLLATAKCRYRTTSDRKPPTVRATHIRGSRLAHTSKSPGEARCLWQPLPLAPTALYSRLGALPPGVQVSRASAGCSIRRFKVVALHPTTGDPAWGGGTKGPGGEADLDPAGMRSCSRRFGAPTNNQLDLAETRNPGPAKPAGEQSHLPLRSLCETTTSRKPDDLGPSALNCAW